MKQNTIVVIPARMASTRLPGKPLADIHGMPMIVHCWKRAIEANIGQVLVAAAEVEAPGAVAPGAVAIGAVAIGGVAIGGAPRLPGRAPGVDAPGHGDEDLLVQVRLQALERRARVPA